MAVLVDDALTVSCVDSGALAISLSVLAGGGSAAHSTNRSGNGYLLWPTAYRGHRSRRISRLVTQSTARSARQTPALLLSIFRRVKRAFELSSVCCADKRNGR